MEQEFQSFLQETLQAARDNCTSSSNKEWNQVLCKNHVRVESRASNASKFRLFKSTTRLRLPAENQMPFQDFVDAFCDYDARGRWDGNLLKGRVLAPPVKVALGEETVRVSVVRYSTAAAMGGIVSPRIFTDLMVYEGEEEEEPKDRLFVASVSCDDAFLAAHADRLRISPQDLVLDEKEQKMVRATNLQGGCLEFCLESDSNHEDGSQVYSIVMIGFTDIGGWLSSTIVNAASANAFSTIALNFCRHVGGTTIPLD